MFYVVGYKILSSTSTIELKVKNCEKYPEQFSVKNENITHKLTEATAN